ncbi:Beta-1,3-galactosyl-O-glycosyl-glycoprotein beta-1,6-N-acetylglucosaminyltransferase [Bulinus truncatus]|nr:Beta-1,3-galactosyl-O-glycosyl-glycoprotein beta-1,6-N-acetylglucosaminyltransferase [Bulinus truncatus]
MTTPDLTRKCAANFWRRKLLRIILVLSSSVSLFYIFTCNQMVYVWNSLYVAPYTISVNPPLNVNDSVDSFPHIATEQVGHGRDATAQHSVMADVYSFLINLSKTWNSSLSKNRWKQSISSRRHLDFNCKGRQLDEMEKTFRVSEVNCRKILSGDHDEMVYAQYLTKYYKRPLLTKFLFSNLTANCELFQSQRGYIMCPLTSEEENFSLAFSMMVYKDIEMVERLLRSIYRPQNYYCIHVDKKSDDQFMKAVSAIANCFENVFLAPERVDVQWGRFSVLEPELICMKHLWKYKTWKYFINLTGQEFPLKTNWELVQILKAYNGANDIEGTVQRANMIRWRSGQPPHNITAVKGSVHIAVNRDFVDYVLHNQTAKDLLDWVKTTRVPDETFFSTLNHNPQLGIRGSYKGLPETDPDTSMGKPFLTRFKNWGHPPRGYPCAGRFVREICILSTGDLPILGKSKHLFANKFYLREDPVVIGCLEEMIFNNTRDEFKGDRLFNSTYYSQLGFVLNQIT